MAKLGVGIIGCGNISAAYLQLGPLFAALDIRAVADIDMDAASARASEFGVRAETVDDLLAASDIDVIVNLTVPAVHYEVTRRILEAGKHAYSEKPLVLTLDEGKALRDLAEGKGLRIGSAPDTFLGGAHQAARAAIDDGAIGTVTSGTCHVLSPGMEMWHPNPDFFFKPGAGPVLDIGPYYVTNLIQLIGPVRTVAAISSSAHATRTIGNGAREGEVMQVETPTNIHALLEFASGATVTLGASWDVWSNGHTPMELYGTEGTLFVPDPNFFGGEVGVTRRDDPRETLSVDHPLAVPNHGEGEKRRANYRGAGLADMVTAIDEGRKHRCDIDLAVHAVDVMTGILTAGETRSWVDMTTTCERPAPLSAGEAQGLLA